MKTLFFASLLILACLAVQAQAVIRVDSNLARTAPRQYSQLYRIYQKQKADSARIAQLTDSLNLYRPKKKKAKSKQ